MPVKLDNVDMAILKSLMRDGRKSFRAISREIKVSTPTVKTRYERLVNYGLIKAVRPEIDLSKLDGDNKIAIGDVSRQLEGRKKRYPFLQDRLQVKLNCDFCKGPVHDKPKVLKFANFERFFCCTECRASYRKKYGSRIEMLKESHRKR